jgi:CRISPR system Cascade subunit CasE
VSVFLTKFEINRVRRGAKVLLASPQAMHAAALASFPAGQGGRVLWRVDRWPLSTFLYLLSDTEPDLTHLVEQAGWPTTHTWQTRDYTPVLDRLARGDQYGFRLTANPTRSTRVHEGQRSQRVGHVTAEQQLGWLLERGERLGVRFGDPEQPTVSLVARGVESFRRQRALVTVSSATFGGVLTVADPDLLRAAITTGIGPAKAYGCGLLTLAPPSGQAAAG